jgi:deoxycytidine triphosphate deaminase
MILVDRQIDALCQGIVPDELQCYYSELWEEVPSKVRPLATPYAPSLVNPHSLDVRIGFDGKLRRKEPFMAKWWRRLQNVSRWVKWFFAANYQYDDIEYIPRPKTYEPINLECYDQYHPYWLCPGDRLLVESIETFNIPEFTAASFYLKSSRGREWYGHQLAGYIDAGWHGSKLTMEITNDDLEPLPIYPGMRFGQLEFRLLLGLPDKSYAVTGRYNNDKSVMESKG